MNLRLTCLIALILGMAFEVHAHEAKQVLLISSYNSRFPTYFQQINGLKSVLDSVNTDIDVEFMDRKRFIDSETDALFYKSLKNKLERSEKYDVILSADDDALNFVLTNKDELFKDIPIVFFGVNNIAKALEQNHNPNVTGVIEAVSMKETIDLMIALFPDNQRVCCIVDSCSSGLADVKLYREIASNYPEIEFEEINFSQLSLPEYKNALKKIPATTPVLLLSAYQDKMRQTVDFDHTLDILDQYLSAPLFHLWEHGMGQGFLGGKLISHYQQGKIAGGMVYEIIKGQDVSSMDVLDQSPNVFKFDYNELAYYQLDLSMLPQDAIIINQPVSFLRKYKSTILILLFVLLVLISLIIGLSFNILKRKKIARQLKDKNSALETLNGELLVAKEKAEEASKLKTEFLHNMSHEIRTPMNGIIGFSELLNEGNIGEEKQKRFSEIVLKSGRQLLNIMDDILEISRLETRQVVVEMKPFSLNELLTSLHLLFSPRMQKKGLDFTIELAFEDEKSYVVSDRDKVSRILINLLENALKFTSQGSVELSYFTKDDQLFLYVKDTGVGISIENQDGIFDRFTQEEKEMSLKYGGLGLGLSISKENASLLDGDIVVESEKGKGATFYVSLPYLSARPPRPSVAPAISKIENASNMTVLVAEDEEVNYFFIETLLNTGFRSEINLLHVLNGRDAVSACMEHPEIDLVLMDIKMPVLNGFEATKEIKVQFPKLPVIALTAYATTADREKVFKYGCDGYISKPIDKTELFNLIEKYLKRSEAH